MNRPRYRLRFPAESKVGSARTIVTFARSCLDAAVPPETEERESVRPMCATPWATSAASRVVIKDEVDTPVRLSKGEDPKSDAVR
jgi:hypothetical protein